MDVPPTELEVEFNVEVFFSKEGVYRSLGDTAGRPDAPCASSLTTTSNGYAFSFTRALRRPRAAQIQAKSAFPPSNWNPLRSTASTSSYTIFRSIIVWGGRR